MKNKKPSRLAYILALVLLLPSFVLARDFRPDDVKLISIIEIKNSGEYDLSLQLDSGALHRFDEVEYTNRVDLYEQIAYNINRHRYFESFDDEDISPHLFGAIPWSVIDVSDIKITLERNDAHIFIELVTGETIELDSEVVNSYDRELTAAEDIVEIITAHSGFKGSLSPSELLDLASEFKGIIYRAPEVESGVVTYSYSDQVFITDLVFVTGDEQQIITDFKETRKKVLDDIASILNFLNDDSAVVANDFADKLTWQNTPILADQIESIIFDSDGFNLHLEVNVHNESGFLLRHIIKAPYDGPTDDVEIVAIRIADILEDDPAFGKDVNILDIVEKIEAGDVDETLAVTSSQGTEEQSQEADNSSNTNSSAESQDSSETQANDSASSQEVDEDALVRALFDLIIAYIIANDLDIELPTL